MASRRQSSYYHQHHQTRSIILQSPLLLWFVVALLDKASRTLTTTTWAFDIQRARVTDALSLSKLVHQSVLQQKQHGPAPSAYYNSRQIEAWVQALPNEAIMRKRLLEDKRVVWVAYQETIPKLSPSMSVVVSEEDLGGSENDEDGAEQLQQGKAIGMIDLERDGHIDFLFVHPDFVRKGVATALYAHLEDHAIKNSTTNKKGPNVSNTLFVEASEGAKSFFERQGFRVQRRQSVFLDSVELWNYQMTKELIR